MAEYKTLTTTVQATQWFKNGDHPEDGSYPITVNGETFMSEGKLVRRFRRPDKPGTRSCDLCGHDFHIHGWIDVEDSPEGLMVCPSDYVVTNEFGDTYPTPAAEFEKTYNLKAGYGG